MLTCQNPENQIPSLSVVLILSSTPRPLFLQAAGVAHISFPPYTRKEAITIILNSERQQIMDDGDLSPEVASKLYPQFVSTVYDALIGPTAGSIPLFKSMCEKLWPQFVSPLVNGETPPGIGKNKEWDFSRLLVRNRSMFGRQGESALVHRIVSSDSYSHSRQIDNDNDNGISKPLLTNGVSVPSLPYYSTLVLTSGYLAAHIPSRLDTIFFSRFSSSSLSARNKRAHHRRRLKMLSQPQSNNDTTESLSSTPKKRGGGGNRRTLITKSTLESAYASSATAGTGGVSIGDGNDNNAASSNSILSARPFPLERLIAIYHAVDPNPPANPIRVTPVADVVYTEFATLRRLRLLVPASSSGGGGGGGGGNTTADIGEKWCVNVSGEWVGEMAKSVGIEIGEWLAGGLD